MDSLRSILRRTQQLQIALLVVAVFVTGFALGNHNSASEAQSTFGAPAEAEEEFEAFWQVYSLIESQYIDEIDMQKLVDGAIGGMVDSLGDQFSGYMDPELYAVLNDDFDGNVEGIGAEVSTNEETGEITIANVMPGTPAMRAGIMAGDVFMEVNGESVVGWSQLELVGKVRGRAGTEVKLVMRRDEELIEFNIIRAVIEVPNISYEVINNLGYIKLNEFNAEARNQIDSAVEALNVNNLDGLILDLRGNPGGLLSSVIDVASGFVEDGVVVIEQFGDGDEQTFEATGNYLGIDVPVVILVDETSASASELLAGALQDRGVATIVGETTFGKGTVQTWSGLVNGGGVRLTIARWLTPNRNWIHEVGVTPDIMIEWTRESYDDPEDPQLDAAVNYLESLLIEPAN